MSDIYLKIYVENNDTLVFEGQGNEDVPSCYYPARWEEGCHRIGTVALGHDHISITSEAKEAFKRIVNEAKHTGDDTSCIDIFDCYKSVDGHIVEETPTEVAVSYIGDVVTKLNIEEVIHDDDFTIGTGEGCPKLHLLDKLAQLD